MNATRPLGFWLKLVDSLIDEQFAATLEEHGVTRRQWQVLNLLEQHPASEAELATALSPFFASPDEPQTVAEHLNELVESGWISQADNEFSITDRGHMSLLKLSELVDQIRAKCGDGLSEQEYATTVSSLEQMARNFGWSEHEEPNA